MIKAEAAGAGQSNTRAEATAEARHSDSVCFPLYSLYALVRRPHVPAHARPRGAGDPGTTPSGRPAGQPRLCQHNI